MRDGWQPGRVETDCRGTHEMKWFGKFLIFTAMIAFSAASARAEDLHYTVSWFGNTFSGANDKWVQNFLLDMVTDPDGTCHTWSHWDEGGKKFGVYKDGDVIGNKDVHANSLEVKD